MRRAPRGALATDAAYVAMSGDESRDPMARCSIARGKSAPTTATRRHSRSWSRPKAIALHLSGLLALAARTRCPGRALRLLREPRSERDVGNRRRDALRFAFAARRLGQLGALRAEASRSSRRRRSAR